MGDRLARYIEVASPGRRLLALLIDGLVLLLLQLAAYNLGLRVELTSPWGLPIVGSYPLWIPRCLLYLLLANTPHFAYFLVLEPATQGFTIGKRLTGIRVAEGGRPACVKACAVRNILRVVDYMPTSYLVGIVSVLLDRRSRRVGDLLAGTVVVRWPIRERPQPTPAPTTVYPESTKVPRTATGSRSS